MYSPDFFGVSKIVLLFIIVNVVVGSSVILPVYVKPDKVMVAVCPNISGVGNTVMELVLYVNGKTETVVVIGLAHVSVPCKVLIVTVYIVVTGGNALGLEIVELVRYWIGAHTYLIPPLAWSWTVSSSHLKTDALTETGVKPINGIIW